MNEHARQRLLEVARASVAAAVKGEPLPEVASDDPELQGRQGCFVTLKNRGRLRGCLGWFTSEKPLLQLVNETARDSATQDSRFFSNPVTPDELPSLDIEISVLSPLRKIENPLDIELGTHGIYIKKGRACGCFLPQVATETGWSKEDFLGMCCAEKAGLSPKAWRDPDTEVSVFTAEILH